MKLKRMLLLATVVVVLACVMALSAFAEDFALNGITYDPATSKISGLTGDYTYYIAPYDVTGAGAETALDVSNGEATVPTTMNGLVAIVAKNGNETSEPFVLWTPSEKAGKFSNLDKALTQGAESEGKTLLSPGKFVAPKLDAMYKFGFVTNKLTYHLRGYTYTKMTIDGVTAYKKANNYEGQVSKVGIYYGFTSEEAFPIEYFKRLSLDNSAALQGSTSTFNIVNDDEASYTSTSSKPNGSYWGNLVLYYVNSSGEIGEYPIKGTKQTSTVFTNHNYIATDADIKAFEDLKNCYVVGFALLPYAEKEKPSEDLFGNYCQTGGNVYIPISSTYTQGFNLSPALYGITYDPATSKISGLTEEGYTYYIAPYDVTGAGAETELDVSNGEATVPTTMKGLVAIVAKNGNGDTSKPFVLWTLSDKAGTFTLPEKNLTTATFSVKAADELKGGVDLLSPGEFVAPELDVMGSIRYSASYGLRYKLIGWTYTGNATDGFTGDKSYESDLDKVGFYYGFTSEEAFPIEYFEKLSLPKTNAVQYTTALANNYKIKVTYDGETYEEITPVPNGNTYQGDLKLYYVDSKGDIGTHIIKGTVQTTHEFIDHNYIATDDEFANLKNCYVVGYALLPYANINQKPGNPTRLFGHYNANNDNVRIPISAVAGHTVGFNLTSLSAPVVEMVGGDTLTVTNYDEKYDYQYKAGKNGDWTDFEGSSVSVDKAGTTYYVRACDGYVVSEESNEVTSHGFVATGTSLVLGGEIGIKTTFDVSDADAFNALKFYEKDAATPLVVERDANSVTIYVPAKDKTKNFEYRYTYDDEIVKRSVSTVASYISTAKEDYKDNATNLNLVNAIDSYTTQADIYFDENKDMVVYEATNPLAGVTVDNPVATFDDGFKKAYRGTALILEGKTAIRHYFDATSAEQYIVTIGGEPVTVQYDDLAKYYYVDVEDISASNYDVQYEVMIGENSVKYSVLNYLKNKDGGNTKIGNLARAMYDYHVAAKAYDASQSNN